MLVYPSGLRGQTANLLFVGSNPTMSSKNSVKKFFEIVTFFIFAIAYWGMGYPS